jgi:crotonobetainyl-CoA:carnitine CoA-transferase CaiB-like acyl-CoA transferase
VSESGLLGDTRVLDFSRTIVGSYATKLLADAGADVVKVEPPGGDPLRRFTISGADLAGRDGALFQYLNAGKRSVIGDARSLRVAELLAGADIVVEDGLLTGDDCQGIRQRHPQLCVVSSSPFGRAGPWIDRPATEFTLQALCGSIAGRGVPDREPLHAGGRIGEWIAGTFVAIGALAALRTARRSGRGDHVDVATFDCMCTTMTMNSPLTVSLNAALGAGPAVVPSRTTEIPSVAPTADGYVGFCTVTAQQFRDFLAMIDRPDLLDDAELSTFRGRQNRRADFLPVVQQWTGSRTTDEIVELASLMRVPVAPVGRPDTVVAIDQCVARGVFAPSPSGEFVQPRAPYAIDGTTTRAAEPAPALGAHQDDAVWDRRRAPHVNPDSRLPLEGIRVLDLTAFWAGPFASHVLALLGADVIHVESIQRPDGMRFALAGAAPTGEWWERSAGFHAFNVNKRGITLDLSTTEGRALLLRAVEHCDAVVENFSPRVLDNFGLSWDDVRDANPRALLVRMPAFGLSGPWRDRTGFAQTIEQATGLAWITGHRDGLPTIPRGPCDPLAGAHAAFALLAALDDRDRAARGHLVEAPMLEAALNIAAEIVIEHSAYGHDLHRDGNRGPLAAPQGVYACRGTEEWLALAVETDEQWRSLAAVLGDPAWARAPSLCTSAGRRAAHDDIDQSLESYFAHLDAAEVASALRAAGVPAERVAESAELVGNPQLRARGLIEAVEIDGLGCHETLGLPIRFASHDAPRVRHRAPRLGEHNREVLAGLLGLADDDLARLADAGIIGERPLGL